MTMRNGQPPGERALTGKIRSGRLRQARLTLLRLSVALFLFAWTNTAGAYSLAQLINDESEFSSLNQDVIFSDFTLLSTGIDESLLELYEVVPNKFGFWLFSPDYEATDPGEISFSYQAEAAEGLAINGAGLSLSRLENTEMNADGAMWLRNLAGGLVSELDVSIQNGGSRHSASHSRRRYDADWAFFDAIQVLRVSEAIDAGNPPVNFKTSQKFFTEPIPEPTTALLLGLGIVGLAARQRLRSS
ncbi:PEP-CTERM sorting domain-containing protein [Myxococcota bacterium]|nr:PEP-CTERM sorting domain-containing protein [Myxococcota bacterium]